MKEFHSDYRRRPTYYKIYNRNRNEKFLKDIVDLLTYRMDFCYRNTNLNLFHNIENEIFHDILKIYYGIFYSLIFKKEDWELSYARWLDFILF